MGACRAFTGRSFEKNQKTSLYVKRQIVCLPGTAHQIALSGLTAVCTVGNVSQELTVVDHIPNSMAISDVLQSPEQPLIAGARRP